MARGKVLLLWAVCLLLPLAGCQKGQESQVQQALEFRTALLEAAACRYHAGVTADFGDRVCAFDLDCAYAPGDNTATLRVAAPELLEGISASVDGETAQVTFDGTSLELGTMAGGHVAPMQLPQLLGSAWAYGYVESQAEEDEGWLVTYRTGYDSGELLIYTRFDESLSPRQAEVYWEDACVLTAEIRDYALGESPVPSEP